MLGWYVRRLAEGGLVAALTATSPARLAHPDGGEPLAGTNPLAIAIPSSDGARSSPTSRWAPVTYGDVLRGAARAGGARPLRRRAGAQGVRARARARAARRRARRRGLRRRARRGAAGGRSRAGAARARRRAYGSPATRSGARSSSSSAHRCSSGSSSSARSSAARASSSRPRLGEDAGAVVEQRRMLGLLGEAGVDLGERTLVVPLVGLRVGGEEVLPGRDLVLPRLAAEREHGRARLLGAGVALHLRVAEEDGRAGGHLDLLAVEDERGPAGEDDVELLVPEPLLVVLLDDVLARPRSPCRR